MDVNADFSSRAVVHAARLAWTPSPTPGVERRMLDRLGDEVARATSVVRYAPASQFPAHTHGGGEEFLVLDGVFSDETGDFPAGTYVRNPPGTRHAPASVPGCTILVKLWQFDPTDATPVRVGTDAISFRAVAERPRVEVIALHHDEREDVRIERWPPDTAVATQLPGGGEFLVLEGEFRERDECFEPMSWLRLPTGATLRATAGASGCRLWVKTGHLAAPIHAPQVSHEPQNDPTRSF